MRGVIIVRGEGSRFYLNDRGLFGLDSSGSKWENAFQCTFYEKQHIVAS